MTIEFPFVETTVARRIHGMIDIVREHSECGAIVGEPGVGKTRALHEYATAREGVCLMTVTAVTGNALRDLFRELAERIGIYVSGSIADTQRQMFRYDLSGRVLILDEAQNLKLQAFREVLNLRDFAGLPIVFCGNAEVLKRVNVAKGPFAQIADRVAIRVELDSIPDEDADAIANMFGLEGMEAYRLARAVGVSYRLRALLRVLQAARERAGERKTIKAQHIRDAIALFPQYQPKEFAA